MELKDIDWVALCEIFRLAPLGMREPEKLKITPEYMMFKYDLIVANGIDVGKSHLKIQGSQNEPSMIIARFYLLT